MVGHQRHPPGLPLVGEPGESAHHGLESGGGLTSSAGLRADGRPPPRCGRGAAADLEEGPPPPFKDAGPGYAAPGSSGYAGDTQAVALDAASLQGTLPLTEELMQVTGQNVRVDRRC